jgi:hypothetical protein
MTSILYVFIIFLIVFIVFEIFKHKPKWLVILYFSITERPYPSKKQIERIGQCVAILAYILILTYVICFDK